jgi:hypothetical protein
MTARLRDVARRLWWPRLRAMVLIVDLRVALSRQASTNLGLRKVNRDLALENARLRNRLADAVPTAIKEGTGR